MTTKRRYLILLGVGLFLIVGTASYLYFACYLPEGRGPAGPPVPREAFAKPWFASNLEDPNLRGYDAIRRVFLIEIARQAERLRSCNISSSN